MGRLEGVVVSIIICLFGFALLFTSFLLKGKVMLPILTDIIFGTGFVLIVIGVVLIMKIIKKMND